MKKNNNNAILIAIVALIIGGAAGFFGGTYYQKTQRASFAGGMNGAGGARMMRNGAGGGAGYSNTGAGMGFRPVTGEITSADAKSITVKLADGSSKIVVFSDKTAVNKADKASISDLKTGNKVMVIGQTNSDGSVTAQNIQLNPIMRTMPANNQPK